MNVAEWMPLVMSVLIVAFGYFSASRSSAGVVRGAEATVDMAMRLNRQLSARVDQLEAQTRILSSWVEMLSQQVRRSGVAPVTYEMAAREAGVSLAIFDETYSELRQAIVGAFDMGELTVLARDAGFNPDEIAGTTLSERAAELIDMAHRRGRMLTLVQEAKKARPQLKLDARKWA